MTSIWWIRRDLRLTDNLALHSALKTGDVIPVFIIDPAFSSQSPRRRSFLYEGLHTLDQDLKKRGSYLVLRTGRPVDVLHQLMQETKAQAVFAEEDFTPYAHKRDTHVAQSVPLHLLPGQTAQHPSRVHKQDGKPYTVYTPYSKTWKAMLEEIELVPAPDVISTPAGISTEPIPAFGVNPLFPAGEQEALTRLDEFAFKRIHAYDEARNRMDLDGTSSLSPYLRFGMLGLRQAVRLAKQASAESRGAEIWLNELIWREFYIQILYHFPYVSHREFNPALMGIRWRNNIEEFECWKEGRTGVPIVDAAMRQLKETGWMHNRARMIVASFLVKDLLIDWRWGEAWFMECLLDGDPAANNGGWQWTAGTGTDAAPYFRIFNPVLQSAKFDPLGEYIRKWVHELRGLNEKEIHAPWEHGVKISGYPEKPIVDRALVKERTLQAYKQVKSER
ncbi:MAG TPA: deoxyribodipyrimidine photo-lyase [Anaerolineales bacterium]|nr:deoxyribodipyrimidine photo-lyase [Anaerolineales bacterium]HMX73098.1 deoxyribodipyrimidine photo-lyase [Anaerolineales bacterium]HMZ42028.1 deoxyribodipyrimidine photo-lyase [Anaerolineales bacterium]HNA52884.1 deoxyribodipyrimidine photo-lyase [Anaerolineales bacterium]HNC87711.1 deoxyribodipyrimidine photo-lyase [Anaerolineales bacterium]